MRHPMDTIARPSSEDLRRAQAALNALNQDLLRELGEALGKLEGFPESAYLVFLNSIAYSFYPVLMLLFVFLVAGSG